MPEQKKFQTVAVNKSQLYLSLQMLIVVFVLSPHLMGWVTALTCIAVLMRVTLIMQLQMHQPGPRTLNLMSILCAIVLAYTAWPLGLLLAMVNLLVMASALKLMQLAGNRDYFHLVSVSFFLIGCGFIFYQSLAHSLIFMGLCIILLVSLAYHVAPKAGIQKQIKKVITLSLQALPVAALLFLILPQLGPLWRMPKGGGTQTGLSEEMTPGDIARLSQSADLAFRATFEDRAPNREQLYWRTIVLEQFDGKTWHISPARKQFREHNQRTKNRFFPAVEGQAYNYDIIAEASGQPWLFALDLARSTDSRIWQSRDYQLINQVPLQSPMLYEVSSYPQTPLNHHKDPLEWQLNLQQPKQGNPETREWTAQLRQQYSRDQDFVQAVLNYFVTQPFRYTLRPDAMPVNPMDTFLFQRQAGFCAHYASAFAYTMRLGGIPARVVTGYLGGELGPGGYLSIYQYDAHAWVEIWADHRGWIRIDPTVLVSPLRLSEGLEQAVAHENSFLADSPLSLGRLKTIPWVNNLRLQLENIDYLWSRWVLGFNPDMQQDLFKSILGKASPGRIALLGIGVLAVIALWIAIYYIPRGWLIRRFQPLFIYHKALALLAAKNISRPNWQGPDEFANEAAKQLPPQAAQSFTRLTAHFVCLHYQALSEQNKLRRQRLLKAELQRFRKLMA